jgi:hypothetical protein
MGVGYPVTETLPNLVTILKMLVAYEFIFATCISTIKMSVMFFYLRVFVNDGLRLTTKLMMGFVFLWSLGNILQVFLICRPFAATYDPTIKSKCGNQVVSFIAIGAFNVITDAIILTLPIPTIWGLKMSRSARLGLSAVFLIGLMYVVLPHIFCALAKLGDMENADQRFTVLASSLSSESYHLVYVPTRDGVGKLVVGRKNGELYSMAADNGHILWTTATGPSGVNGGLSWGIAVDEP